MSAPVDAGPVPAAQSAAKPRLRAPRSTKVLAKAMRVDAADADARRRAACVLEVLAGLRSPEEAACALSVEVGTYHQIEGRALRGLLQGCMPGRHGRQADLSKRLEEAERRCAELAGELQRHQALLRSAQRTAGLLAAARPPAPAPGTPPRTRKGG